MVALQADANALAQTLLHWFVMNRALRHVLAASAVGATILAAASLLSACTVVEGHDCTLMAGATGLSLVFNPVTPGDYDIVVRADVVEAQCRLTLRGEEAMFGDCKVRLGSVITGDFYGSSSPGSAVLTVQGTSSDDMPRSVDVQVFDANGNELLRRNLQPSYVDSYPNGRQCDVTPFRSGQERIGIPEVIPSGPSGDAGAGPTLDAGTADAEVAAD